MILMLKRSTVAQYLCFTPLPSVYDRKLDFKLHDHCEPDLCRWIIFDFYFPFYEFFPDALKRTCRFHPGPTANWSRIFVAFVHFSASKHRKSNKKRKKKLSARLWKLVATHEPSPSFIATPQEVQEQRCKSFAFLMSLISDAATFNFISNVTNHSRIVGEWTRPEFNNRE